MKKERNILLTGGAGFIGSALLRHLNDLGKRNIIIVDNLAKSEKWKNLVGKQFRDILHKNDLFHWLEAAERDLEAIFHLGACSSTTESDCDYLLENNYRYSVKLAEYAIRKGIRFIYASSAATYGEGKEGFSDKEELTRLKPLNMYGYSKHLFDLWLAQRGLLDKVVGLKYFNVFGPNEYHKGKMASAIVKMVCDAREKNRIYLFKSNDSAHFKDGEQVRDFIYVKDAVKMTADFLSNSHTGIFNIGFGKAHTWNELARAVIEALESKATIEYIEMPLGLSQKYQNYTLADMAKYKEKGLIPAQFSLKDATLDYVRHYLLESKYW